ncbi:hypothetical protein ACL00O_21075, partial [Aeromonas sanarellii]
WQVQFTLKEFNSVPEKREARLPGNPANLGKGSPGATAAKGGQSQTDDEKLSKGEAFFKKLDDKLGDVLA